jgi:hypothetical protein
MKSILVIFLFFSLTGIAQAEEKIWIAFIKADNDAATQEGRLEKFQARLKSVFGFENYHLLDEAMVPLGQKYEQWVLPDKNFYLKILPIENSPRLCTVHFEVYRQKMLLVSGSFHPTPKRPLFISGPEYENGRLLFLLQIIEETSSSGLSGNFPRRD